MGRETNKQRRDRQAASAREKAAASRALQQRAEQRRRALVVLSSVVVLAVIGTLIAVVALHKTKTDASGVRVDASPAVVSAITTIPAATFTSVNEGSAQLALQRITQPPLAKAGKKPELLYIGGEFCPICAAERWSMTAALSRFGTFSNLKQMRSAADDGDLATLSFFQSSYTSKYLTFTPVENVDRASKPLEKLSSSQIAAYHAVTGSDQLVFPFLDFNGMFSQRTEGYDGTTVLGTKDQAEIADALGDPTSSVSKAIVGEANNITAGICGMTNNQPSSVCLSPTITTIQSNIPNASA